MVPRSATWEFLNSRLSTGHDTPRKKGIPIVRVRPYFSTNLREKCQSNLQQDSPSNNQMSHFWIQNMLVCYVTKKSKFPQIQGYQKMASFVARMQPSCCPSHRVFWGSFSMAEMPGICCILGNLTKKHVVKKSTNPTQPNHIKSKISQSCWQERNIPPNKKTSDSDSKGLQVTANACDLLRSW